MISFTTTHKPGQHSATIGNRTIGPFPTEIALVKAIPYDLKQFQATTEIIDGQDHFRHNWEMKPLSTPIAIYNAECTDLWADCGSWSANCSWVKRRTIVVASNWSDTKIARRIKRALGIQGMKPDAWAGAEFSWRSGCVGAYADCQ